jgi:hypothetical protein
LREKQFVSTKFYLLGRLLRNSSPVWRLMAGVSSFRPGEWSPHHSQAPPPGQCLASLEKTTGSLLEIASDPLSGVRTVRSGANEDDINFNLKHEPMSYIKGTTHSRLFRVGNFRFWLVHIPPPRSRRP